MKKGAKPVQLDLFGNPIEDAPPGPRVDVLRFEDNSVRMIILKGEPWWVLMDVAKALEYRDAADAARRVKSTSLHTHPLRTDAGTRDLLMVNEAGLFRLIMRSNKREAVRFQDWVTEEVLPEIRRTGRYEGGFGDRVGKRAKKLKCGRDLAKVRCEVADLNKLSNARLASDGASPRDFAAFHNAGYRAQFGAEAPALRKALGLPKSGTPLDRMGALPLAQNLHARLLANTIIQGSPAPMPLGEQCRIFEAVMGEYVAADFDRLGEDHAFVVVDDDRRGKVIDVRRRLPAS